MNEMTLTKMRAILAAVIVGAVMLGVTGAGLRCATAATELTNQPPTYLRDIVLIIMGKCSRCHNEQARFVYNWLDYRTAFADRWEIKRRVWDSWKGAYFKESMPIANSPESFALTDEERVMIRNPQATGLHFIRLNSYETLPSSVSRKP